jgi:hypothetical protein
MNETRARTRRWPYLLVVLLLWAFFAQTTTSMVVKSPTVDEQAHLMRGYVYLELGDLRFKIGHPILANALNAFPIWALTDLSVPTDDPAWLENRWGPFADHLIWQPGNDVDLIFFLSRLVTVALGMLFAALVFRWARQLWGGWGGLVALALFVFDPTIVAHSRFTTDDVAVSFFYFAATYGLWRYLEMGRARDLVLAGVAFGLAQGCKFSALLLMPVFVAVVGLWPFLRAPGPGTLGRCATNRWRWLLSHAVGLLAMFAIGGLTLWAAYRFELRSLPGWPLPVPAAAYFEDLIWESRYFGREGYVFLRGQISATGWWYYFLVAFALKSPLPAHLLLGATLVGLWRRLPSPKGGREGRARLMALLLPASVYLLSTLVVSLNIGYRLFIPVLPYLYVLTGRLAALARKVRRTLLAGALAWSAVIALCIHPHYLAYFNVLAGGPDHGWRYLVDSNIDWGQDLPALHDVVERDNLGQIKLSYFGTAHPSYYGLDFEPLPTWEPTPEQGNPFTRTYYPHDPAPGIYAISATHLQGVVLDPDEWDTYAWFRDKPPFANAGYSILLYQVEPTGPPVDVALSGLQIDELAPETFAALGTNDVRLRWFDARTSLVVPAQPGWYATLGADTTGDVDAWGQDGTRPCATVDGRTCQLYPPDPAAHAAAMNRIERLSTGSRAWHSAALIPSSGEQASPLALPVNLGDELQFLGYEPQHHPPHTTICNRSTERSRRSLQSAICRFVTVWRVTAPPDGPRAIFVHLLTPDGQVAAQWDGLDVPVEGWREGDTILQAMSFDLPAGLPSGQYWLQTGVYNPATMERLPVLLDSTPVAGRILLQIMHVGGTY